MERCLMGIETEYGLRYDVGLFLEKLKHKGPSYYFSNEASNIPQCGANLVMARVSEVLAPSDYLITASYSFSFWTRGGARCYVDTEHIEVATAECATFSELVFQKNVGDVLVSALLERALIFFRESLCYEGPLEVCANNTALPDRSTHEASEEDSAHEEVLFSRHENYLVRRDLILKEILPEEQENILPDCEKYTPPVFRYLARHLGAFFASRLILGGAGHITPAGDFVISPRINRTKSLVGATTQMIRPLICAKDEPNMAESYPSRRFLRYHHIAGDTNITDHIMVMKMAFTYWVLRLLEIGYRAPEWLQTKNTSAILGAAHVFNTDPSLSKRHKFDEDHELTAAEILCEYLGAVSGHKTELGFEEEDEIIFGEIARYLEKARKGYESLLGESEWATKYHLLSLEKEKRNLTSFDHPTLRKLSIVLHNIDRNPKTNPFVNFRNSILPANLVIADLKRACRTAPRTRAFVRGLAIYLTNKFGLGVVPSNGQEWQTLLVPSNNESDRIFDLNKDCPWSLSEDDIKRLVDRLKPWLKKIKEQPNAD